MVRLLTCVVCLQFLFAGEVFSNEPPPFFWGHSFETPPVPGRNLKTNPIECGQTLMVVAIEGLEKFGCPICGNPYSITPHTKGTAITCINCGTTVLPARHENEVLSVKIGSEFHDLYAIPHPMSWDTYHLFDPLEDEVTIDNETIKVKTVSEHIHFEGGLWTKDGEATDFATGQKITGKHFLLLARSTPDGQHFIRTSATDEAEISARVITAMIGNYSAWLTRPKTTVEQNPFPMIVITSSEESLPQLNELIHLVKQNNGQITWDIVQRAREFKGNANQIEFDSLLKEPPENLPPGNRIH